MENQRKPLSFGMTMLASAVGVVVVSALGGLLTFISMIAMVISLGSMDKETLTMVKNDTFLTVDLGKIMGDRSATGLQASFSNEKTVCLIDAVNAIRAAAADGKAPAAPFDIAKFAGIFAAVGMALGLIGAALAGVIAALKGITSWWQVLIIIAVVMLIISGPSMFIAWRKLRRRDLGPILNANGWAINAKSLVNTKFGKTLTSLAKFPKLTAVDPEARKKAARRRFWCWFCGIIIVACVALWLCNVLAPIGIKSPLKCFNPEPAVEEVVEAELPVEEAAE